MDTSTEIIVAVLTSITAIIVAVISRIQNKKNQAKAEENERKHQTGLDLIRAKAKAEEEKMRITVALLEKQATDNRNRIETDLKLFNDFIHSHADEHKALDAKFEAFNRMTEVLVILTEQNKTLFKNQEKIEIKVEKFDEKLDVLKDAVLKGGV